MKKRIFIAINLPEAIKDVFDSFYKKASHINLVRWERPEKLHITLVFLGYVNERDISQLASGIRTMPIDQLPFSLQVVPSLGGFPSLATAYVLWFPVSGDLTPLGEIVVNLKTFLKKNKFPFDDKPFKPHVTIGRFKNLAGKNEQTKVVKEIKQLLPQEALSFTVSEITIYHSKLTSKGSTYEKIAV